MQIDFDGSCLVHPISGDVFFGATVDDAPVSCRITEVALKGYFGASSFADLKATFQDNLKAIEAKAREQIIAGHFLSDWRSFQEKSIVVNLADFPLAAPIPAA